MAILFFPVIFVEKKSEEKKIVWAVDCMKLFPMHGNWTVSNRPTDLTNWRHSGLLTALPDCDASMTLDK